ncbi:tumor necrosis factor receptor superfamily member 11B [Discoglossus pictus]
MYELISCTLVVLFHIIFAQESSALGYDKYYPRSFSDVVCDECPPGTYVKNSCTAEKKTECAPCPAKHYADSWNFNRECQYCSAVCKELQYVKQECNGTHSRVCECIEGRYLELEFCLSHTKCPPGYGVVKLGTPHSNTICEKCPKGNFSNKTSSTDACQKHTDCKMLGLNVASKGDSEHDTVCQGKEEESMRSCEIDVTLCEEALFRFSLELPDNSLTVLGQSLPGKRITSEQMEWIRQKQNSQEQTFQLFKLWKIQNRQHESVKHLTQNLEVCEKGILKHIGHLNLTVNLLTALMQSLPGKKIGKPEIDNTTKMCDESKQILKLLSLWRNKNGGNTITGLKLLKSNKLPKILRRRLKKLDRFINSGAMFRMYQKLLSEIIGNQTQPAKPGNL